MTLQFLDGLGEVVVIIVNRAFLCSSLSGKRTVLNGELTEHLSDLRIVGDVLCDNVGRALKSRLNVGNLFSFLGRNELFCIDLDSNVVCVSLLENVVCKRLKTLIASDGCSGLTLGSIGKVDVLKLYESFRIVKGEGNLGSELALTVDEVRDLLAALVHLTKVVKSVVKVTKCCIVKTARNLLTVS